MNRKARRILEKKLGEDFPIEEFLALMGYYNKTMKLSADEFMIYLLKRYVPILYDEKRIYFSEFSTVEEEEDARKTIDSEWKGGELDGQNVDR